MPKLARQKPKTIYRKDAKDAKEVNVKKIYVFGFKPEIFSAFDFLGFLCVLCAFAVKSFSF
jgi:hypothetical protein